MTIDHWFDGFSTLHKFELKATGTDHCDSIAYSSTSTVDEAIEKARKTGKLDGITFGQKRDPCDSLYKKFKSIFEPTTPHAKDFSNIGVALAPALPAEINEAEKQGSDVSTRRVMSLVTDATSTKTFDADTLEPLGVARQDHLHPSLVGPLSCAHPCYDRETSDYFNYNLDNRGPWHVYRVFRANPRSGDVEILAEIKGSDIHGAYIHSFFMTENFLVLCIWPAYLRAGGLAVLWERNIMDAMAPWDANAKATWVVVDRRHKRGVVAKYTSPAFFSFHATNAWEEPATSEDGSTGQVNIIAELCQYNNDDILHKFYYKNILSNGLGALSQNFRGRDVALSLSRYRLRSIPLTSAAPAPTGMVAERIMSIPSPAAGDLPQINPRFGTKPHRYVWMGLDRGLSALFDSIGKTDTQTGDCLVWSQHGHTPGEPIFVPRPDGTEEDDGVCLSVIFNGYTGSSYLLCLNAKTMREMGRAEVGTPVAIGFHGVHIPAKRS